MRHRYIDSTSTNNSSTIEKTESTIGDHFRWKSIKQFLYVAHAFSSSSFSFDLFSKVVVVNAHIIEYVVYAVFIGVSYMFMDFFIKQFTRRLDSNKALNPLMRGVSFGILLQTAVWAILHANNLADSVRYFMVSMNKSPSWTKCHKTSNVTCLSSQELILNCRNAMMIDFSNTSAHVSYTRQFSSYDRNSISMRLFVIAIVWICNFFVATFSDNALLKLFKFSFLYGLFSTAFVLIFLMFSTKYTTKAFYDIMNIRDGFNRKSFNLVTDPFGVGLIGAYDFGHLSPRLMVDNAALIFTIVFIATAFARSLIVRVLYMKLTNCVHLKFVETPHYLLFAILPLSTEFMDAHKLFAFYIYSYLLAALVSCLNFSSVQNVATNALFENSTLLINQINRSPINARHISMNCIMAMFTSTISRLLHNEFRSVKNIYIVGLLCFLGFTLSLPLSIYISHRWRLFYLMFLCHHLLSQWVMAVVHHAGPMRIGGLHAPKRTLWRTLSHAGFLTMFSFTVEFTTQRRLGVLSGLNTCTLYLGGFKVAIVMWVYGVQRFATDVQFWLGFKPTRFWTFLWVTLPVFIFILLVNKVVDIFHLDDSDGINQRSTAIAWTVITVLFVLIFHVKIVAKYILRNNLVGIFKSDPKYGPPDLDDRKRRRNFNELYHSRQCHHDCLILDSKHECNHLPLIFKEHLVSEHPSLTNIYDAGPSKKRPSSTMDASIVHMN